MTSKVKHWKINIASTDVKILFINFKHLWHTNFDVKMLGSFSVLYTNYMIDFRNIRISLKNKKLTNLDESWNSYPLFGPSDLEFNIGLNISNESTSVSEITFINHKSHVGMVNVYRINVLYIKISLLKQKKKQNMTILVKIHA